MRCGATYPISRNLARGLLALTLLIGGLPVRAQAEPDRATVALPAPVVLFLAIFVAEDHFWAPDGLDIKIVYLPGVASMNAVISGSVEFALASGGSVTRAAAHGQRLLALANLNNKSGQFIALRKDIADAVHFDPKAPLAVRALALKGRTIATGGIGSVADAVVRIALRSAGLDSEKDVVIAPMQPPDILAAFARKAIDGFSLGPPFAQQVEHDGTGVILLNGVEGDPPGFDSIASALLLVRPSLCSERRALCEKMGHSMLEATRFLHEHPEEAIGSLKKRFDKLDDAVLAEAGAAVIKMTSVPPSLTEAQLANGDRMNSEAGFLKPEDRVQSYDGLYTNDYLR